MSQAKDYVRVWREMPKWKSLIVIKTAEENENNDGDDEDKEKNVNQDDEDERKNDNGR